MKLKRLATIIFVFVCTITIASSVPAQEKQRASTAIVQSQTGNASSPQPPKKKSGLAKFNEKLNQINLALTQQAGTGQAPAVDQTAPNPQQLVAPHGPSAIPSALNSQTTAAPQTPPANDPNAPTQAGRKKGFLDKLNQGLAKTNAKLNQIASTVNPGATQSDAQPAPANPAGATTEPANATVAPTRAAGSTDLAGTSWDLLSMTKKGEKEHVNSTTPNVEFCHDGSWAILHNGSSEGGKYQIQGSRLVMRTSDGALYGDYPIKRNGNEMILDDGTWVLRLRYYGPVKC